MVLDEALKRTGATTCSPFEKLFKVKAKLNQLRVFGCDAWKFDHYRNKSELSPKAKQGIHVGVSPDRKGCINQYQNQSE